MSDPSIDKIRRLSDDGFHAEALELCGDFLSHAPASVELYFERANILNDLGRRREAIEDLGSLIALEENHSSAYFQRALWLLADGMVIDGLEDLRRVVELGERYYLESALFYIAVALLNLGKNAESLEYSRKLSAGYSYNSRLPGRIRGLLTRDQLIAFASE